MQQGRQFHGQSLEAWVMDEHRIGLKPILRRVWAPRGQRPIVRIHPRYEWLYIYAFAQPSTERSFYLLMPTVSIEAFSVALSGPFKPVHDLLMHLRMVGFEGKNVIATAVDNRLRSVFLTIKRIDANHAALDKQRLEQFSNRGNFV